MDVKSVTVSVYCYFAANLSKNSSPQLNKKIADTVSPVITILFAFNETIVRKYETTALNPIIRRTIKLKTIFLLIIEHKE